MMPFLVPVAFLLSWCFPFFFFMLFMFVHIQYIDYNNMLLFTILLLYNRQLKKLYRKLKYQSIDYYCLLYILAIFILISFLFFFVSEWEVLVFIYLYKSFFFSNLTEYLFFSYYHHSRLFVCFFSINLVLVCLNFFSLFKSID